MPLVRRGSWNTRIEGIPVIIRFKTYWHTSCKHLFLMCIEGIPVIIRFKTAGTIYKDLSHGCIEGIPVIIRFKTRFFV